MTGNACDFSQGTRTTPPSSLWEFLPANNGWLLRVCDDHWFNVFGTKVVLSPMGIGRGHYASEEAAKREAERQYRESLEAMVKRGERLARTGQAGLAMLERAR